MTEIYMNGKFVGFVDNAKDYATKLREERRRGTLSKDLNVYFNEQENCIYVEGARGRIRRPLIIVKEGKSLLTEKHIKQLQKKEITWNDLVDQGIIEYIDAGEEENCFVSFYDEDLTSEHTHLEVTPLAMIGLTVSLVPYGNYTQSARLNIGSKNQKQSIGFYASNFPLRMDMDVNLLHYPQVPIVNTIMNDISNYKEHPAGQNLVIAIMSYEGYNMEDAIIINKGSVERGLGRSTYYRPRIAEELRYPGGLTDEIVIPDKDVRGYRSERDYRFLEEDGIISPESVVNEGDVVIGKTSPPRFLNSTDEYSLASNVRRESSIYLSHGEKGVVDFILLTENEEGNRLIQVRVRDQRVPEIGDKFTSRHGQKGVIGLIVPQTDMPFSSTGIIPDLIFSPHGIPSRMTISHLLEIVGGKVGALSGRYVDGTTFLAEKEDDLRKELASLGFNEAGTETFYNGHNGRQMKAKIFVGNMYYLKLKHLVDNKLHARARGPIQLLTRQPREGRSKEGGLRLGEMEKDTIVAHGASMLLKERFDSDKTIIPICENCGMFAIYEEHKEKFLCPICGDNTEVTNIEISYAFKLLVDELKSMCIYPKFVLKAKY